jgi:hypothetical protein
MGSEKVRNGIEGKKKMPVFEHEAVSGFDKVLYLDKYSEYLYLNRYQISPK